MDNRLTTVGQSVALKVAALYVQTDGPYFGLPDVDPWDEKRDARLYKGNLPVVAHPPCARWSLMGLCRGYYDGDDGGCFQSAIDAVERCGGVLEHPAHSLAWKRFGLPRPPSMGWSRNLDRPGWSCEVDQRWYGHEARKPTWLYYVGEESPPMLIWGKAPRGDKTVGRSWGGRGLSESNERSRTPVPFRDVLLDAARRVGTEV
jgi:hypothetical protein